MFLLDTLTKTLFYTFLAGSMLGIGLKISKDDLLAVVRDRSWLVRTLIVNFLLIPAVGVLAAKTFALKPENALALILLSCAPGGLGALQFLTKTREEKILAYSGATAFLLSFLSVIVSPFLISFALPKGLTLTVPYLNAALYLILFAILPLVLGMVVNEKAEAVARKFAGPITWIATLAFIGVIVKTQALTKWAKAESGARVLIGVILLILVSMLIGWILGGPRKGTRAVLATASSMRNVALAMGIAARSFPDLPVLTPLVVFASVMAPANLLLMAVLKVAGKGGRSRLSTIRPRRDRVDFSRVRQDNRRGKREGWWATEKNRGQRKESTIMANKKPNILIIWGDDIGWFNISAYNHGIMGYQDPEHRPHRQGRRAVHRLVRAAELHGGAGRFITGQSPIRTGLTKVGLPGAKLGLQPEDPTIAELLKPQGYMSGQFGKNHLGDRDEFLPTVHGFDEFFGNLYHLNAEEEPENADYPKRSRVQEEVRAARRAPVPSGRQGRQKIEDTGPLTMKRMETMDEEFTAGALDFIERQRQGRQALLRLVEFHPDARLDAPEEGEPRARRGWVSIPTAWSSTTATSDSSWTSSTSWGSPTTRS